MKPQGPKTVQAQKVFYSPGVEDTACLSEALALLLIIVTDSDKIWSYTIAFPDFTLLYYVEHTESKKPNSKML